jgi:drug/metabolite transporter (DMT)-like permease
LDRALQGDLLALASAATLAIYYTAITKMSRGVGIWMVMAVVSIIAAASLLALSFALETRHLPTGFGEWGALAMLAVLGQVLG